MKEFAERHLCLLHRTWSGFAEAQCVRVALRVVALNVETGSQSSWRSLIKYLAATDSSVQAAS